MWILTSVFFFILIVSWIVQCVDAPTSVQQGSTISCVEKESVVEAHVVFLSVISFVQMNYSECFNLLNWNNLKEFIFFSTTFSNFCVLNCVEATCGITTPYDNICCLTICTTNSFKNTNNFFCKHSGSSLETT